MSIDDLYTNFVIQRHRVYEARQAGAERPWTTDPVVASRKFTNVFRVLDPGSQFVLTDLATDDRVDLITRLVLYRITNLPATWRAIKAELGGYPTIYDVQWEARLVKFLKAYRDQGNNVFSGAYIIVPEPGTKNDKVEGAVRVAKTFADSYAYGFLNAGDQETRFKALTAVPGIGKFLAMQILTDWGYLQNTNRENDYIIAGPGATRGAKHLRPDKPAEWTIREFTKVWADNPIVNVNGYTPSLMDVQNTFCEFSKYHRFAVAGKPYSRAPYRPAHPGPQPAPVLPTWMRV